MTVWLMPCPFSALPSLTSRCVCADPESHSDLVERRCLKVRSMAFEALRTHLLHIFMSFALHPAATRFLLVILIRMYLQASDVACMRPVVIGSTPTGTCR